MANKIYDRVAQLTESTESPFVPSGSISGFRAFEDAYSDSETLTFCITDGIDFEVHEGTWSISQGLVSSGVTSSSNGGAAVAAWTGDRITVFATISQTIVNELYSLVTDVLSAFAALTGAADYLPYFTGATTMDVTSLTAFARTFLDDTDATAVQTTLGLLIGTNVQAYSSVLTTWAGLTPSANAQSLVTAADYAAMRALLDLEVGTDFLSPAAIAAAYQPLDSELSAIAGLTSAADKVPYFTGSGTAALATLTSFIRTLLDDTTAATARATLELDAGMIPYVIDGGGSAITTGSKGFSEVPYNGTITGWTILGNQSGSIVVDVKKVTYASFPTTSSIAGSEKPTLSSAQKNQDLSLGTWTTSVSLGDILEWYVDSASTVTRVYIGLRITR